MAVHTPIATWNIPCAMCCGQYMCADIPYIERLKLTVLAGLLTTFRLQVPSRNDDQWRFDLEGHKETHSCETVGESHSVPLFIAYSEPRTFAKVQFFSYTRSF